MVGFGFCDACDIRLFADEIEGEDYFIINGNLVCVDCRKEMEDES